jgi:hypothetical protein
MAALGSLDHLALDALRLSCPPKSLQERYVMFARSDEVLRSDLREVTEQLRKSTCDLLRLEKAAFLGP